MSGGSSQPSGYQTVQQNTAPWAAQQPYLQEGFKQAQENVLNRPTSFYPGSTVVPLSNQTNQALGMIQGMATDPNNLNASATGQLQNTLNGNYLNAGSNPYLGGVMDQALNKVRSSLDSQFNLAGRTGSGAAANAFAENASNALTNIGYQNYNDERGRQQQAALIAPQQNQANYYNAGQLANVGGVLEQQQANQLQDQMSRYNYAQQEPANRIANYMGLVQGNYGGNSQSSTPIYNNTSPFRSALGGASAGAGVGSMIGGPWGAGIGGGIGLLGGLLGGR